MKIYIFVICFLSIASLAAGVSIPARQTDHLWPMPTSFSHNPFGINLTLSFCNLTFVIDSNYEQTTYDIKFTIQFYQTKVFACATVVPGNVEVYITVPDKWRGQYIATDLTHQKYSLSMPNGTKWSLNANYFVGFLRGFETLSQLFVVQEDGSYLVSGLPIMINDGPQFLWRGLMIDTARRYLDLDTIYRIIDAMRFMKLTVLHWHIVDEDAFPMVVDNIPELSQYGSVGGIYYSGYIYSVIMYARWSGIRVVPEINTPTQTQSWGRSPKYENITLNCNGVYMGQFDPTSIYTWRVVQQVFTFANNNFDDSYIHFGGDKVNYDCWDQRPSIKEYMVRNRIPDYKTLEVNYRLKQKKMFREDIGSTKKVIYWVNEDNDLPVMDEDVIHWRGDQANQNQLSGRKNEVILSSYDLVDLDTGFNDMDGVNNGVYKNWRDMYGFNPIIPNTNVIGGTTCMWNEIGNKYTFDQKVLQKASVLSERLWNTNININTDLNNIATRLNAQAERLRARGYKVWPVTVEICEKDMSVCF